MLTKSRYHYQSEKLTLQKSEMLSFYSLVHNEGQRVVWKGSSEEDQMGSSL